MNPEQEALWSSHHNVNHEELILRIAKMEWEAAVDALDFPLLMLDYTGVIVRANQSMTRLSGYPFSQLIGSPFEMIFPDIKLPEYGKFTECLFKSFNYLIRHLKVKRESPFSTGKSLVYFTDITEEKKIKHEKEKAEIQLMERLDRWATLGLMASMTAHEINNPLAFIRVNASNLGSIIHKLTESIETSFPPDHISFSYKSMCTDAFNGIEKGLVRIAQIVEELRRYGRTQNIPFERTTIKNLIQSALELLSPKLKESKIEWNITPMTLSIECQPIKIEQAIINLISNAVDAAQEKNITPIVKIECFQDHAIHILIKDNGGGIPSAIQKQLFSTYVSTKSMDKGTGLGLMVSRAHIEAHGGKISFDSIQGEGTTFWLEFPLTQKE